MQQKEQRISPIKQRILHFAAQLGVSKRDFYTSIGVSRGTLESATGITEDVMAKFFAAYPQVSIEWTVAGIGPMLKSEVNTESNCCKGCNQTYAGDDFRDKDNEKHPINKPILYNKEDWMQDTLSEPCSNAVQTLMKHEAVHRADTPSADILTPLLDRIQQQAEEIGALKERIRKMEEEREKLAAAARSSVVADAG